MKLVAIYNMEKTKIGRWIMEGYPAKYHALPWLGVMSFTGPKDRVSIRLVKHELIHHYQAEREGWLRWNINYYWELWNFGYMQNTYEVEAYARMNEPLTIAEHELVGLPYRLNRRPSWFQLN